MAWFEIFGIPIRRDSQEIFGRISGTIRNALSGWRGRWGKTMDITHDYRIELLFDKKTDGRFHIHSPSVPGLHLAGRDLKALIADIEPAVKDLLLSNKKIKAEHVRWVPPLDEIHKRLTEPDGKEVREIFVVQVTSQAA
jgi:predicted RNase H-like HicB family nuclease